MKYVAVLHIAARQAFAERAGILMRGLFYIVILLIFSRLWLATGEDGALGIGVAEFIWYIALTEWVVLAMPQVFLAIEEDVRRGDIAYLLARPASYLWMRYAEALGQVLARMAGLVAFGLGAAWLFAGALPMDPRGLWLAIPLGLVSVAVMTLLQLAVGLTVFWLHEATPVYWVVQKLMFVFGGLFFPLQIYPEWMQSIAHALPFAPLINGVGRMAFGYDPGLAVRTGLLMLAWGAVLAVFCNWLFRKGLKVLDVHGG